MGEWPGVVFTFLAVLMAYVHCKDVPVPRKEKVPGQISLN